MSTIAAISTAQGQGGIGVIRVSGEESFTIVDKIFKSVSGKKIMDIKGYTALFGHIYNNEEVLDEAVVLKYVAPKSFTGENVVEISCHGGMYITKEVLNAVIMAGASLAEPGEFTKRAYLNGKMDLTEAESVMDIISAKSKSAARAALFVKDGALFKKSQQVKQLLLDKAAHLSAWADYPEEDIPEVSEDSIIEAIEESISILEKLLSTYDMGQVVKEGIDTVIAGRPNAGKSTLMNLLVGREKSIVTNIAGTTRDVVEDTVLVGNVMLKLSDTAGIRDTDNEIEKIGVQKTFDKINGAGLVIALFDNNEELNTEDIDLINKIKDMPCIAVINKIDLDDKVDKKYITDNIENVVYISAKQQDNIDELKSMIEKIAGTEDFDPSAGIIANERQRNAIRNAVNSLYEAKESLAMGMTMDAITVSLQETIDYLLELTGEKAGEEIVDSVFHNFCVGK
ncbi:tRNA uridine-5-carboxymethylaminomethyl(34) synthesis GTPase MnmE [Ruminococcus sp.]|uniref:tRNA uridine-5-carboxymethylaminomethyl(34) synthesis GTPase MnmE n=1 Tax=Ruminococcus sp. TaxID=41978 RepID=UPI00258D435E|nr:tRNA uridine-5-carboxymethylaminomethyl(34) synthesis GTPase MnmE [Ruminococcus sp.]MEE3438792.1 tRNA uridine-5-carboxymethylaminomethyl(34) synthesis GTPase MnmE [Ruminococcus sp.]